MKVARSAEIVITLPSWFRAPVAVSKELRVVTPVALYGLLAMLLAAGYRGIDGEMRLLFLAPYAVACSAIGAFAAGHDFTHRTLGAMLAMPVSRRQIWWTRMTLVFLIILPLAGIAFVFGCFQLISRDVWLRYGWPRYVVPPIFGGLCLAPWLTLTSRSPLFGTVFSAAIPFFLAAIVDAIARGIGLENSDYLGVQFRDFAMPFVWVAGAVLGWRKFMTLEVIDAAPGDRAAARITLSRTRGEVRRGSALWQLIKKEVMLQRMPVALAGLAMALTLLLNKEQGTLWTMVYPVALVVLMASVASADERQMGTVEWQVLLPIAFWKQWITKFLTTWGMAVIFGFILPLAVWYWKTGELREEIGPNLLVAAPVFAVATFVLVAVTLYVSSLCNSGLKALMVAMAVNALAAFLVVQMFEGYSNFLWKTGVVSASSLDWWMHWEYWPYLGSLLSVLALAMIFAMRNHRYAERGPRRVLRQVTAFAVYEVAVIFSVFTFWNWYTWLH